ncbi:uncharacterized protein [Linepithema humile]|uniref:uncharacterized protein n=1 Tax=Linepithema humile TaxID=83485 RepID=UPI0006236829|nr:PREDICTED: uncharacterized protein LOC105677198 [Linepithema humile]XP_012231061.1 PREDICTED: uncharacterized protein LOC105677198 [Linepithema humile]
MGRACCILGCPSGGDAPSHHIPKNPALFQKWKSVIYSEKMRNMTDEQIGKCAVCYRHFTDEDYLITFRVRKLRRGVTPSLNLPNIPAIYNEPNTVNTETAEISNASLNTCIKEETTSEISETGSFITEMEVSKTADIALFEDLPDETEPCLKQLQLNNQNKHMEQTSLAKDLFKLYCMKIMWRKRQAKFMEWRQYKKQAEQYEKTSTIQKLLSFLTSDEIASIKTKIIKSKYSPKVYVKEYHEIAKRKALEQL